MTNVPTHFEDKHRLKLKEDLGVCSFSSVDIIKIIEKMCEDSSLSESHVKTENFEIRIRR